MARISGKLTAKSLGWDRNTIGAAVKRVPADTGRVPVGRIVGIVSGIHETVNEETGEIQTGLKGNFRGVSALNEYVPATNDDGTPKFDTSVNPPVPVMNDTGHKITMTAGRCYLPGGIQDMIEGAYRQAVAGDANATVQFAVDLFAVPATNKAGYSYDADTLMEAAEADPLDMLLQQAERAKALPAPAATDGEPVDPNDNNGDQSGQPAEQTNTSDKAKVAGKK